MLFAVFLEDVNNIGRIFKNKEINNMLQKSNKLMVTIKILFILRFFLKTVPPLFHITKKKEKPLNHTFNFNIF